MGMDEWTNFGIKNSLTKPSLTKKFFDSLGDENDEPLYTYTDLFMRKLVRNSIRVGKCNAFNQHYKFEVYDEVFNIISHELCVGSNLCDSLDKYFEYVNKHEKQFEEEY